MVQGCQIRRESPASKHVQFCGGDRQSGGVGVGGCGKFWPPCWWNHRLLGSIWLENSPHILLPEQIHPLVAAQYPRALSDEPPSSPAVVVDKTVCSFLRKKDKPKPHAQHRAAFENRRDSQGGETDKDNEAPAHICVSDKLLQ